MDDSPPPRSPTVPMRVAGLLVLLMALICATSPVVAAERVASDHASPAPASNGPAPAPTAAPHDTGPFQWPVDAPFRVARAFVAPPNPYGAGHRGIDIDVAGEFSVRAPAEGVVAFAGRVADRSVITISHGGGLVSTLEPVDPLAAVGDRVQRGQSIATLAAGGHAESGQLHWGVRLNGQYINPLVLLDGVPRAVLLPLRP